MTYAPTRPGQGKHRCHYCGTNRGTTRDHIIPWSRGGPDRDWNLVPACHSCNQAKGADLPTCQCKTCATAIERHRNYVAGFPPRVRAALEAKVAGLWSLTGGAS